MIQRTDVVLKRSSRLDRIPHSQRGQVFVWALVSLQLLLFGAAGFVVDMGRVYLSYQQLVMSTDAAALAGGSGLPSGTTAISDATSYSGLSSDYNNNQSGVTMVSGYPAVKCIEYSVLPIPCATANSTYNAIQVKQQVSVNMTLAKFFGAKSVTLTSTATASARGSASTPYNIALIIDTTASMGQSGSDSCTDPYTSTKYTTAEGCALVGARVLLHNTAPCAGDLSTCPTGDTNAVDMISLMTFPNGEASTMQNDYTGSCSGPTINTTAGYSYPDLSTSTAFPGLSNTSTSTVTYGSNLSSSGTSVSGTYGPSSTTTTATYQVTPFLSDYRTSDASTSLSTSSDVVAAVGGKSGCTGLQTPGGLGTFYAGALVAAQELLLYQQTQRPGSQNAIVLLSDGAANATKMASGTLEYVASSGAHGKVAASSGAVYPSKVQQCQQAVNVASSITSSGTTIYAVAYGSETTSSSCSTDTNGLTPCQAMTKIASNARTFFTDAPGGVSSGCTSSENPETGLSQIFAAIAGDLTKARLVPASVFNAATA